MDYTVYTSCSLTSSCVFSVSAILHMQWPSVIIVVILLFCFESTWGTKSDLQTVLCWLTAVVKSLCSHYVCAKTRWYCQHKIAGTQCTWLCIQCYLTPIHSLWITRVILCALLILDRIHKYGHILIHLPTRYWDPLKWP